jgi:hypothetical protein
MILELNSSALLKAKSYLLMNQSSISPNISILRTRSRNLPTPSIIKGNLGALIFRYDNARHKPKLPFENHKHLTGGKIIEAPIPELADVFEVIMDYLL